MKFFPVLNLILILSNISVLILGYLFIDRRMLHSLKGILNGIQKLSHGETVQVHEKGIFLDVALCLNQTSDLLRKQSVYRENWIAGVSHDVRTPCLSFLDVPDNWKRETIPRKRLASKLFTSRIKPLNYGN